MIAAPRLSALAGRRRPCPPGRWGSYKSLSRRVPLLPDYEPRFYPPLKNISDVLNTLWRACRLAIIPSMDKEILRKQILDEVHVEFEGKLREVKRQKSQAEAELEAAA